MQMVSGVYTVNGKYMEMKYSTAGTARVPHTLRQLVRIAIESKDAPTLYFTVNVDRLERGDADEKNKVREIAAAMYGYRPTNSDVYALRKEIERYATR